jgi:acyl-CoA hydrolase
MNTVTIVEVVFPGQTNHQGTLFGGIALGMMDKAAFVAATRRSRMTLVTVASDRVEFHAPARSGDILETTAEVVRVKHTSIDVRVAVTAGELLTGHRREVTSGQFTFVAVDENGSPTPIPAEPGAA